MQSARNATKLDISKRYARPRRAKLRANLVQTTQDDTHIDENGVRQPNPPRVNMFKLVNHIEANRGRMEGKHLKFPIASHPKGPYKHHMVVRVDTGADVNSMNENTFNELFSEAQLSVCPHEIQNFGNSVADISILGQFCTDWVNSYVIVEKDTGNHHSPNHTIKRKLGICLDSKDLNEALERELYHTCSSDEITAKLQGMTVFTILDFKKGYWMVVLHPESKKLTCMALPFGRFQWTRLPMGTVVAQDIFQSKLDSIFIGMEGVTGIADDMVIAGRDKFPSLYGKMYEQQPYS